MWVRLSEIALAIWLALSPVVFPDRQASPMADLVPALAIALIAVISMRMQTTRIHLANALVGIVLIVVPLLGPDPVPADGQNRIVVGFVVAMLAVIPSRAVLPPADWSTWYEKKHGR